MTLQHNTFAAEALRQHITKQQWDGKDRLQQLEDCFVGQGTGSGHQHIREWIVGAARRILTPYENRILVIVGEQGSGKSEFARWIAPSHSYYSWFGQDEGLKASRRAMGESESSVAASLLAQFAIIECFEVPRASLFTNAYVRTPYSSGDVRAIASVIVTTNFTPTVSDEDALIVELDDWIDWSYTKLDIGQIWAQAVHEAACNGA